MNVLQQAEPITILLVEDNPGDSRLIKEVFKDGKVANSLIIAKDGIEALTILKDPSKVFPDLILLDLNLPRKKGLDVLEEVKSDPNLKRIPVIVLTTSNDERDILKSYDLHASAYLTKPVDLNEFITVIRNLENFWLTLVKYPPKKKI
ncbi:MAG: response regulator [Bacteroidetes bacterium]|nr:response regulator [Bacteroidota bacterium]